MILTVTLNPLLERRFYIDKLIRGGNHRSKLSSLSAGGKGINVSRQLNHLNTTNLAFTFLGGNNGKLLRNILAEEKISFTFIQTKNETRDGALAVEGNGTPTTFFGMNQILSHSEVDEFKTKLRKMIENCEIVVFSGSSPGSVADDIFPYGIETANEFDKISVLDTYGTHYKSCIDKAPTIIHNNISELSSAMQIDLSSEEKIIQLMNYFYSRNIKQSYITNGGDPVYASNFDFTYKAEMPHIDEINSTGSGDAFTAGIVYGLHNSLTFEQTLRFASGLGVLNALQETVCNVKPDEIESIKDNIIISSLGKKIKTIE